MNILRRRQRVPQPTRDRKSTRLNSSHGYISYAVFCLKKKKKIMTMSCSKRVFARYYSLPNQTLYDLGHGFDLVPTTQIHAYPLTPNNTLLRTTSCAM